LPQELHRLTTHPAALTAWLRRERLAWQHALAIDPLLPRDLWPTRYCGPEAWRMRQACYRKLSEQLVPA
jgi:DNA-binding transcriptional regulator PaaX